MRLREAHEKEAPLGFARVTKATVIPAGQRKEIHALTKSNMVVMVSTSWVRLVKSTHCLKVWI